MIAGISENSGSTTRKPATALPLSSMMNDGVAATRAASSKGRVSNAYAAACKDVLRGCSAGVTPIANASKSIASFSLRATSPK